MGTQVNRPEPEGRAIRAIRVSIEDGKLVARRETSEDAGSFPHSDVIKLDTAWVSGLSDNMSTVVVGTALLDFILEWLDKEPIPGLSNTFNVEKDNGVSDDMSEV